MYLNLCGFFLSFFFFLTTFVLNVALWRWIQISFLVENKTVFYSTVYKHSNCETTSAPLIISIDQIVWIACTQPESKCCLRGKTQCIEPDRYNERWEYTVCFLSFKLYTVCTQWQLQTTGFPSSQSWWLQVKGLKLKHYFKRFTQFIV